MGTYQEMQDLKPISKVEKRSQNKFIEDNSEGSL
jgi:hypothetical protein